MQPIQIKPIGNDSITIHVTEAKVHLPKEVAREVSGHWQRLIATKPQMRNGEVFTVTRVEDKPDGCHVWLAETDYAHYMYSQQMGDLGTYTVRIIHSAVLVLTADNKLIFGAMGDHTSRAGVIQCCGGGIDHNDITDGLVDMNHNTVSELLEELGIDAGDRSLVVSFSPAYLKFGGPTGKMTVVYTLHLTESSDEFLTAYDAFTKRLEAAGEDPEFSKVFSLANDREAIDQFISKHADELDEYMPILLQTVAQ